MAEMNQGRDYIDVATTEFLAVPEMVSIAHPPALKAAGRFQWLQRLCIWVLHQFHTQCAACVPVTTVQRHQIGFRGRTFMERLWERRMKLQRSFELCPKVLLIGPEAYEELMTEVLRDPRASFSFQAEYYLASYSGKPEPHQIEVRIIPYMQGMLLL